MAKNDHSAEKAALLMLKGMLLDMPQERRNAILDLADKFKAETEAAGDDGFIAMSIAAAEVSLEY